MNTLRHLEHAVLSEGREWTRRRLEERWQAESDALPPGTRRAASR